MYGGVGRRGRHAASPVEQEQKLEPVLYQLMRQMEEQHVVEIAAKFRK